MKTNQRWASMTPDGAEGAISVDAQGAALREGSGHSDCSEAAPKVFDGNW